MATLENKIDLSRLEVTAFDNNNKINEVEHWNNFAKNNI